MIFIKIFYSLFGIALGIAMLKYRKTVYGWTGKFYWAEKYLGNGGTLLVIIVAGLGLLFISIAYPFGVFDDEISSNPNNTSGSRETVAE